ncbi:MAG: mercuric transport protein MerTP [Bacteroidetes bacterium]|nr:mercuric transport protein MerTP [Bacteroidota bacterium]
MKLESSAPFAGIITAIASSLCCITPVVAFLAGTGSLASTFSWIEPARPYFLGATASALGFAWYLKLRPVAAGDDCGCEITPKRSFLQSKSFLVGVSLFAAVTSAFPYYSCIFFPKTENAAVVSEQSKVKKVEFTIEGMTCTGCENHVKAEISKLPGIVEAAVSYERGTAIVKFDEGKTSIGALEAAIHSTGYSVVNKIQ